MIAVYHSNNASPFKMCSLPVASARDEDFIAEVEKHKHPLPNSEVLFLENDKIVVQKYIKFPKKS